MLNRQRQTRVEENKNSTTLLNDSNIVSHTPTTGQSAVTQLHNRATADGVAPSPMHLHGIMLDNKENMYDDDDSDWLHRNDAYQMQCGSRRMSLTQLSGVQPPTQ